ncbi:DUF3622 domain-containing protein [Vibrio genomosp. F6]|uniref:DUF3622 domain-containing protein n=1 Tax=Vibrio genomosp. F6 str. FF-238 TaxID=1191298 RepID=A0A1E5CYT5_9VIBR|nr:DUF3622 domain-containing protein [Vibrio genomosp. F6]OEE75992.1 hypothetical protein A130_16045 [Vibrio genomosp. F6 str. FF-238]
MSKNKKYDIRTIEKRTGWTAEITRQVTSRRVTVSKREMGFETEALAIEWAEKELEGFVKNQAERNERKGEQRKAAEERAEKRKAADLLAKQRKEAEQEQED